MMELRGPAKRIDVVATRADYDPLVQAVESVRPLRYVRGGQYETARLPEAGSACDLPDLGIVTTGRYDREHRYLIAQDDGIPLVRTIYRNSGGLAYEPDYDYPAAVWVTWGGLFEGIYQVPRVAPEERERRRAEALAMFPNSTLIMGSNTEPEDEDLQPIRCLISGEISTISTHPDAVALIALFRREFRKRFVRRREFWVGPEAAVLLDAGVRCGTTARGPWLQEMASGST